LAISVAIIKKALGALGGEGHLDQIEAKVRELSVGSLPADAGASIRARIQERSSDTRSFKGGEDIFESVHGVMARMGVWRLRPKFQGRSTPVTASSTLRSAINGGAVAPSVTLPGDTGDDSNFDPTTAQDSYEQIYRQIKARRGQQAFRNALLAAYNSCCMVTGCSVKDVLEAAHIVPYQGANTNHPTNGLLLRADLHTLFDCGLFSIDPHTLKVAIAPMLLGTPEYAALQGRTLQTGTITPSTKSLAQHFAVFIDRSAKKSS
jgi:hypothetical protein